MPATSRAPRRPPPSVGWEVSVIDAQGSADQANAAIQNFVQRGAKAIVDMVFPVSSIGAGHGGARDAAKIPVVTWGGGLGGSVIATNGSGGPMAVPIVEMMVKDLGGKGEVLALTYHTGEVCRNREIVMDQILAKSPDIKVSKNEVRIPGYFEDGAQYATAWLALHPAGSAPLAIWGCWDDPSIGAISALRQAGPRRRQGLRHQRQRPGAGEHPEGLHDGDRLAGLLHRGLQHARHHRGRDEGRRGWQPKAVEVTAVVVTKDTVEQASSRSIPTPSGSRFGYTAGPMAT